MKNNGNEKAYLALTAICIIWGTTFLAMKVGARAYPSILLVALRQSLAGCILWTIGRWKKFPHPSKKDFFHIAIVSFLIVFFPAILMPLQLKNLPSGLMSLINATVPMFALIINLIFRKGKDVTMLAALGILLGFSGMFFLYKDNVHEFINHDYFWGFILALIGAASSAGGLIYSAKMSTKIHPIYFAGYQYILAAIALYFVSFSFEEIHSIDVYSKSTIALIYASILGSVIGLPAYLYALSKLPSTLVSVYAYINPIIALTIGAIILNEKLDQNIFIAGGCIIAGVYIINNNSKIQKNKA